MGVNWLFGVPSVNLGLARITDAESSSTYKTQAFSLILVKMFTLVI